MKMFVFLQMKTRFIMRTSQQAFNPIQIHLLEMFSHCETDGMMDELKDVLADFYARKVQEEADQMWNDGTLNGEAIEQILSEHWRTPYLET